MIQPAIFNQTQYFVIDYNVLEQYICEIYGISDYDFCESFECVNDTEYTFNISKSDSDIFREAINKTINNLKHGYGTPIHVLTDLCDKGLIEAGDYLIKVSW